MAVTAAITLGASTGTPGAPVRAAMVLTNGGSTVSVVSARPSCVNGQSAGIGDYNVPCAQSQLRNGDTITAGNSITLYFDTIIYASTQIEHYIGAHVLFSDGSWVDPTALYLLTNNPLDLDAGKLQFNYVENSGLVAATF